MNSQAHEHFDAFPSVVNKYMTAIRGATASDQAGRCADLLRHYLRTAAEHRRITAEKERAMQRWVSTAVQLKRFSLMRSPSKDEMRLAS